MVRNIMKQHQPVYIYMYIYIYIYIYLNVVEEEKVGMKKTIFLFNVNSYKNSFSFLRDMLQD